MAVPHLRARRLSAAALALVALTAVAGCRGSGAGLDEASYIDAMTRLSLANAQYLDDARRDSARAAVLEDLGVSAEALVAFAERHGADVARMTRIWETIRLRVDSIQRPPPPDSAGSEGGLRRPEADS